ncbi:MAG: leucine-rich repeat protein [Prevotellaceae bacterium]|nr:leucine-rich repeat protein [Candidatus Colivivens equi]
MFIRVKNVKFAFVPPSAESESSFSTVLIRTNWHTISCKYKDCPELISLKIPSLVKVIDYGLFSGCTSLRSVYIPESVIEFKPNVFQGCSQLREIHCRIKDLTNLKIPKNTFTNSILSQCTFYVPIGTGYAYSHHPIFSKCKDIILEK